MVRMDASRVTQGEGGEESRKRYLSEFSTMDSYSETTLLNLEVFALFPVLLCNNTMYLTHSYIVTTGSRLDYGADILILKVLGTY